MRISVTTDHNIEGSEKFSHYVETEMRTALHRYADLIARVEVHFSDENVSKSGNADKRCLIEAHPVGQSPMTASDDAATLQKAFDGAAKKMAHQFESSLGKLHHHKGEASIRTEPASE
jgi:ribosomal subunit interface protein